jgi:hypothetical protein
VRGMNFRPLSRTSLAVSLSAALALASASATLPACSGDDAPKNAMVKAGDMPAGESWNGVYYHPVFGYLHMVENNGSVIGKWQRADKSRWGELSGTALGNVLHFTWKEHTYGLVGPAAEVHGKGVFVYSVDTSNDHKIGKLAGQFGLNADEVGSNWDCIKQDRMEPKLESITGDQSATGAPTTGGGWDQK